MSLAYFHVGGTIPSALGQLTELVDLGLGALELTGTIPQALAALKGLTSGLDLSSNNLTGTVPGWLKDLQGLRVLTLDHNKLTGTIPPALAAMKALVFVSLFANSLTGAVPALPFSQYSDCILDDVRYYPTYCPCNRFSCPLPAGSAQCIGAGASGNESGVHCY
jgi:hypothetical protein